MHRKSLRSALVMGIGCALLLLLALFLWDSSVFGQEDGPGEAVTLSPKEVTSIDGLAVTTRDELFAAYDIVLGTMDFGESEAAQVGEAHLTNGYEWQFESNTRYLLEDDGNGNYTGGSGDIQVSVERISDMEEASILAGVDGNKRDITGTIEKLKESDMMNPLNEQLLAVYAEASQKDNAPKFGYYALYESEESPNEGYAVRVSGAGSMEDLIREATAVCTSFEIQE